MRLSTGHVRYHACVVAEETIELVSLRVDRTGNQVAWN